MATVTSPDMRGGVFDDEESIRLMDYPDATEEIPTLDIADYLAAKPGAREKTAAQLREITKTIGFFYLTGHGIPQSLVDAIFRESKRFHALPDAVKSAIPYVDNDTFKSGYQSIANDDYHGTNVNIVAKAKPNLLSKFTVNREGGSAGVSVPRDPARPTNFWPGDLPGFKDVVSQYHASVEALGRRFLPLWATSLNLPLDYFDKYFVTPHLLMSLLHYPPQHSVGERQYGIAPHTDNAFMTILAQQEIPGLAVRMPSGRWRAVEPKPGTLLVNTGNLMVRWTNGEYLSTKHRVINGNKVDRYSVPVFFGPSGDALIEVLPSCNGPDRPAQYEPTTYIDLRKWYYGKAE